VTRRSRKVCLTSDRAREEGEARPAGARKPQSVRRVCWQGIETPTKSGQVLQISNFLGRRWTPVACEGLLGITLTHDALLLISLPISSSRHPT